MEASSLCAGTMMVMGGASGDSLSTPAGGSPACVGAPRWFLAQPGASLGTRDCWPGNTKTECGSKCPGSESWASRRDAEAWQAGAFFREQRAGAQHILEATLLVRG